MSKKTLDLSIKGLYTSPSQFSGIPEGAASILDNLVIDQPNIARSRRGMRNYAPFTNTSVTALSDYNNVMLAYTSNGKLHYDSDNAGTFVQYGGSYVAPDTTAGARVRFVQANRNVYFLTSKGTYKLDNITGTPRLAGAPRAQSGQGTVTGTTGFLPTLTNVAYRVVWGYRDANNNLILGAPSERIVVSNGGATSVNVSLNFQIPDEVDATWFYQIYRSLPSASLSTVPNDELQQTAEGVPTSGELAAQSVTYTDRTPSSLLQGYLYTNSSQAGILQSNFRPPFAKDACLYKNYVFYANTRTLHSLNVSLLGTGSPLGLQVNDTITFTRISDGAAFTLTGKTVENGTNGEFAVSLTGDPAVDIEQTAVSIARILNVYASNTFLGGYYVSNFEETPGQLEFQMTSLTEQGFYINSTRTSAWTPSVTASGNTFASQNEVAANRVYWSRELQPEAVPIGNWLELGSKAIGIDRIIPLRDGIIVLKQDGVFRITNNAPPWSQSLLDNTVRIIAPNTAIPLDNKVFFLADQAVVAASDSAVEIMSYAIERQLLEITSPASFPNVPELAFGVGYSADRKYMLHLPVNGTDTSCGQQFCYNTITNTWTRWTLETLCGMVFIRDNKLYHGGPGSVSTNGYITQERKDYTDQDYADEDWLLNIAVAHPSNIQVTDASKVTVGSTIVQSASGNSDEVVSISGTTLYFANVGTWTTGDALTYTPIDNRYKTIQLDAGDAGKQKQFVEASFIYSLSNFTDMSAIFTSDLNGSGQTQHLRPPQGGGWGQFSWGQLGWGSTAAPGQRRIRTLIPNLSSRANWLFIELRLRQCFTSFGLSGISLVFNDMSTRQRGSNDK